MAAVRTKLPVALERRGSALEITASEDLVGLAPFSMKPVN